MTMRIIASYTSVVFLVMALLAAEAASAQAGGQDKTETVSDENPSYVKGITSARAKALVGGVIGLTSVIIGWRVRARSTDKTKKSRAWSFSGLLLGLGAVILSVIHLAGNTGGFGTGGGKAGAIGALLLGLIGVTLSGLALRNNKK